MFRSIPSRFHRRGYVAAVDTVKAAVTSLESGNKQLLKGHAALADAKRDLEAEKQSGTNDMPQATIDRMQTILDGYDALLSKLDVFARINRLEAEVAQLKMAELARDKRIQGGEIANRVDDYIHRALSNIGEGANLWTLPTRARGSNQRIAAIATELLSKIRAAFGTIDEFEWTSENLRGQRLQDAQQLTRVTQMTVGEIQSELVGDNERLRKMFALLQALVPPSHREHPLTPIY